MFCVHRQLEYISLIYTTSQMPFSSNKHNYYYNHNAKEIQSKLPILQQQCLTKTPNNN